MAGGGAGSKRSSRQAGNADRKGKGKRSKGSTKEPSLLASLHPTLLGLVFSFYCDCACEEGTFCPHTKDKADFDPCVCMDNCKKQGFPCRMQLRLVNRHWRNCLQAKEDLLNPTVFVDLREAGEEPIPLTVDCLIVTICKSDWLCDRVRSIMASPGEERAMDLVRFTNLWKLDIRADVLPMVPQDVLDRLTNLRISSSSYYTPDEKVPFPSMSKLESLELWIPKRDLFEYDLSNLGNNLPSLTRLVLDCEYYHAPEVSSSKPLSLRRLTCAGRDLDHVHLANNFVETLHLKSARSKPCSVRCNVAEVDGSWCTTNWKDFMPLAGVKELIVLDCFFGYELQLLVNTGIPLVTVHTEASPCLRVPSIALARAIDHDVTVRFVFTGGEPTATYVCSSKNPLWLERVK
jgi:hypothetical protein